MSKSTLGASPKSAISPLASLLLIANLVLPSAAQAGDLSPKGSAIEVENYRCEVTSPYNITCTNIGRVCEKVRAEEKKREDACLGCAIEGNKNYPCKEICNARSHDKIGQSMGCTPLWLGGI